MNDGIEKGRARGNLDEIISLVNSMIDEQPPEVKSLLLEGIFSFLTDKKTLSENQLRELEVCVGALRQYENDYSLRTAEATRIARGPLNAHAKAYSQLKINLRLLGEKLDRIDLDSARRNTQPTAELDLDERIVEYKRILEQRYEGRLKDSADRAERFEEELRGCREQDSQPSDFEDQLKGRDEIIEGLYKKIKEMEAQQQEPSPTSDPRVIIEPDIVYPLDLPGMEEEQSLEDDIIDGEFTVVDEEPAPGPSPEPQPRSSYRPRSEDDFSDLGDILSAKSPGRRENDCLYYLRLAQEARSKGQYGIALQNALAAEAHGPDNLRVNAELSFLYLTTGNKADILNSSNAADNVLSSVSMGETDPELNMVFSIALKNKFTAFRMAGKYDDLSEEMKALDTAGNLPPGIKIYDIDVA